MNTNRHELGPGINAEVQRTQRLAENRWSVSLQECCRRVHPSFAPLRVLCVSAFVLLIRVHSCPFVVAPHS
jgi:hypothetical protein